MVDIIVDALYNSSPVKAGFFAQEPFLKGLTTRPTTKRLITEQDVRERMKRGERTIQVDENTIVTPLARDLMIEKEIREVLG